MQKMESPEKLKKNYRSLPDAVLLQMADNPAQFPISAVQAAEEVIAERGGKEMLRWKDQQNINAAKTALSEKEKQELYSRSGEIFAAVTQPGELAAAYRAMSDEVLLAITHPGSDYHPDAIRAAEQVIQERGGRDHLMIKIQRNSNPVDETARIRSEVKRLFDQGRTPFEIHAQVFSYLHGKENTEHIINERLDELERERRDKTINNKTIGACVLGGVMGIVISSLIFYITFRALEFLSYQIMALSGFVNYFIIHFISKQTHRNVAVILSTVAATLISIFIGIFFRIQFGM